MARGFKTGGRQKGTPNKSTSQFRELIMNFVEGYKEDGGLREDFMAVDAKTRLFFISRLLKFILPEYQSVSIDLDAKEVSRPIDALLIELSQKKID